MSEKTEQVGTMAARVLGLVAEVEGVSSYCFRFFVKSIKAKL